MATDVLSSALALVRLTGALVFEVDLRGAWGVTGHPTVDAFGALLPRNATQLIAFHIATRGRCWVRHAVRGWFELTAGRAAIITRGDSHDLCDQPGRATVPFETLLGARAPADVHHVRYANGDGQPTHLLCGYLGCDRRLFEPICGSLPPVFDVALGKPMQALVRLVMADTADDEPGAAGLRARLAELLFVSALRAFARDLPVNTTGWLAGLRDPLVGRALRALHANPGKRWSVQQLATASASSRSELAGRFRATVGEPPMHYLAHLRLQLAARSLQDRSSSIARVASEVGYDSDAAFQRAFKRYFGTPPATWRRNGGSRTLSPPPSPPCGQRTHERRRPAP